MAKSPYFLTLARRKLSILLQATDDPRLAAELSRELRELTAAMKRTKQVKSAGSAKQSVAPGGHTLLGDL